MQTVPHDSHKNARRSSADGTIFFLPFFRTNHRSWSENTGMSICGVSPFTVTMPSLSLELHAGHDFMANCLGDSPSFEMALLLLSGEVESLRQIGDHSLFRDQNDPGTDGPRLRWLAFYSGQSRQLASGGCDDWIGASSAGTYSRDNGRNNPQQRMPT